MNNTRQYPMNNKAFFNNVPKYCENYIHHLIEIDCNSGMLLHPQDVLYYLTETFNHDEKQKILHDLQIEQESFNIDENRCALYNSIFDGYHQVYQDKEKFADLVSEYRDYTTDERWDFIEALCQEFGDYGFFYYDIESDCVVSGEFFDELYTTTVDWYLLAESRWCALIDAFKNKCEN